MTRPVAGAVLTDGPMAASGIGDGPLVADASANVVQPPVISSVAPTIDNQSGGTAITLTGLRFTGANALTLGGAACTSIVVVNSTTVTAVTPTNLGVGAHTLTITATAGTASLRPAIAIPSAILCQGDSITIGGAPVTTPYPAGVTTNTGNTTINDAISGRAAGKNEVGAVLSMVTRANTLGGYTFIDYEKLQGSYPIFTILGGQNDIFSYAATDVEVEGYLQTISGIIQAAQPNARIVYAKLTVGTAGTSGQKAYRTAVNTWMDTAIAAGYCDAVADFTDASITFQGDNVHPDQAGQDIMATLMAPAIAAAALKVRAPTITSISPAIGNTAGGTTATITGTNLTGLSSVAFGGTVGTSLTPISPTSATVVAPAIAAGTYDVVITNASGSATLAASYTAQPVSVQSITPSIGTTAGGTAITVRGIGLTGTTALTIGGTTCTSIVVVNDTTVTAVTPAKAIATYNVVITAPGGSATVTNGWDSWTAIAAFGANLLVDYESGVGMTVASGNVTAWADQSANANTASIGAFWPTDVTTFATSHEAARFDPATAGGFGSALFISSNITVGAGVTVLTVYADRGSNIGDQILFKTDLHELLTHRVNSPAGKWSWDNVAHIDAVPSTPSVVAVRQRVDLTQDMHLNGVEVIRTGSLTASFGQSDMGGVLVAGNALNGDIATYLMVTGAISDANWRLMKRYYNAFFGLSYPP